MCGIIKKIRQITPSREAIQVAFKYLLNRFSYWSYLRRRTIPSSAEGNQFVPIVPQPVCCFSISQKLLCKVVKVQG